MRRGRVVCDGEDEDIIDTLVEPSAPILSNEPVQPSYDLSCPKCARGYSIEEHVEFLEHTEQCR